MVGVDPEVGSSVLRLWIAAGSAALLVVLCAMAFVRQRATAASAVARSGVVALSAILGASMAWAFLDRATVRDHDADRRALEMRAQELTARTLAPGSSLACLDALTGDSVEAACEKALFASPATVATATSYVTARLTLLSDMVGYMKRGGAEIDSALPPLRHALEADRFGFLAHALAVRDGCTSQACTALDVLHDPSHVRANLSGATLDRYLERYLTAWAQSPDGSDADAAQRQPAGMSQLGAQGSHKVVNIDFPTAASIPAVSIMNPEPAGKVVPGAAAAAAANPNPPPVAAAASPRKARKQAANPPAQAAAPSAPPAPATADAQADPVWTPAPTVPPPQAAATAAAPAANFGPGGAGPVQLTPFAPRQ